MNASFFLKIQKVRFQKMRYLNQF